MRTYRDTMSPSGADVAYDSEQVFERCRTPQGVDWQRWLAVEGDE